MFRQAERKQSKLRMTIDGPAGSGKSYTALRMAHALVAAYGGKIAAVDTERGSLSKYVGDAPDGSPWVFDVLELTKFSPEEYTNAVQAAGKMGYTVLIIDSLSHAWEGTGGALEIKDRVGGADWKAWRTVTPIHNRMVDSMLQSPCHVITTMRSRMEYVQETDNTGRTIVRKLGLAPIQRPGMEYEFDVVCDIDWSHIMTVSKSRCTAVQDMKVEKPGPGFMQPVIEWLSSGSSARTDPVFAPVISDATATVTLDALMAQYGEDAVSLGVQMFAGGKMPGSQAEVDHLAAALAEMQS
jgi:nucleoside-triphosphatase THEP1